ncbi:EAL domain-containing protein [Methylomarinum sp. Ch1-1]|uniref:protein-glutamate O-methyltransferase n=1 Tax=Methylomarinum roseum TaxID=3067653 RepID=A0AAU7NVV0_9GAMM|nr:EAL domain-containing protein [Methylomarinum sp. Ch1-1]MDP4519149.1 EAL domain-containing protein [Methylomarinum sp. Ch1-1]
MIVVGIGASAGGLEALLPFVSHLSADTGMTFVIIQHGSPDQPNLLADILRKNATIPVEEAENDTRLKANKIYVAPHDADVSIANDQLKIQIPSSHRLPQTTIDYFFSSLARNYQEKAIAIVFSGAGSDGANGLKAIKAAAGITMAQTPKSAKFSSMPKAAIKYADVDLTVEPEEAAIKLTAIADNFAKNIERNLAQGAPDGVKALIDQIFDTTGIDFVNYKSSTINRQIHRRMAILQIDEFDAYRRYCQDNAEELSRLANNFLVCVTSFFRDEQSFNALKQALKTIINRKAPGDEIRIWVPGCATGEEAYSIAIILLEELGATIARYRVQIYGTDINDNAVQIARKGDYSENALSGLSRELREKYFLRQEQGYSVNKNLRDLVMFSRQDLIKNPPFIRLDLISCRNLLIYLNQTLQEQVLKSFHYALLKNGILFLGQAESLWKLNDAFTRLDRNNKLFVKNSSLVIRPDFNAKKVNSFTLTTGDGGIKPVYPNYKMLGQDKLISAYAPPSILATREGRILEFYNNCDDFIKIKQGKADFNLFSIIDPVFKTELRAFCHQALSTNKTVSSPPLTLAADGLSRHYRLSVTPIYQQQDNDSLLLIAFEPISVDAESKTPDRAEELRITGLEHELRIARETLRTVTEALENSVSEWQNLNEEAQSTNEELQSTNEELETSNEELQSINEELTLVNDELTLKTKELGDVNDDLRNILESIGIAVIVIDSQMQVTRYNEVGNRFLQFDANSNAKPNIGVLETLFSCEQLISHVRQVIETRQSVQYRLAKQAKHYEFTIYPYRSLTGDNVTGAVLTIEDITESYRAEQQIRLSASVFEAANEAIVISDENNRIISVNPAFSEITGYSKDEVLGKDPKILNSGKQQKDFYRNLWRSLEDTGRWQGKIWNKRKNGEIYPEWLSISALKDPQGADKYVGIFSDISDTLRAQQLIHQQANFDALTKLPNRNLFYDRLQQAMTTAQREQKLLGLMFIDLDGFKDINDALGHSQGDRVLEEIAVRMKEVFRESDTFARFGGDEFTVLIPDLESETDMIAPTEKILEAIQMPIQVNDHELHITASIGITLFPNDGGEAETLLKHADNAMYTAKAEGRNAYRFFTQEMHEKAQRQHRIANDIKNAVKLELFDVYYQPVIDLENQRLCGAEALIRWRHPVRGFISPEEFIPVAESLNLIGQIGEFVLAKACRFIADLNHESDETLTIAVNFSSLQFISENGAEKWLDLIGDSGVGARNVVIEITESLMMSHKEHYIRQLQLLRAQGIKIALDDFGTGFSSLSYLKKLPIDIIKIDRSFIRDILIDDSDASLVESILDIAKNFSLEVIAEGVEDSGQAEFLQARPCGWAQGYYYSKPLPEQAFKQLTLGKKTHD